MIALLLGELIIILWDFVEEDRTRDLPATERVAHTLLTFNVGVTLVMLVPVLVAWTGEPSALLPVHHGMMSWFCAIAAFGVFVSSLRHLAAARRCPRLVPAEPVQLAATMGGRKAVLVTDGTGLVGSRLVEALAGAGHDVTVLTRDRARATPPIPAGAVRIVTSFDAIASDMRIEAIINLAGESISNNPWTRARSQRIIRPRVDMAQDVARLIGRLEHRPKVMVNGSAIGIYGLRGDEALAEGDDATPCFSREVCRAWEPKGDRVEGLSVRTVYLRTGPVLDASGGMLARMLAPFEHGLGGRFGNGCHWMSWSHRDDLVRLIVRGIGRPDVPIPFNGTAPNPVTTRAFTAALVRTLHRPATLSVSAWPLRRVLGAFAQELLLSGQRVLQMAAVHSGFIFHYPDLDAALAAICGAARPTSAAVAPAPVVLEHGV